jgi:hypothetical protein
MGTYRQPAIIDNAAGLKQANAEISKFNEDLKSFAQSDATAEEDNGVAKNFKTLQDQNNEILDLLEKNKVQENQNVTANLKTPSEPNAFLQQLGMDAKDKYLKHIAEGNKFAANQMLKLADGLKGTMTGLNNIKTELAASLDVPRGGPKSINTHLIDNDIFKLGSSLITDPDFKNMEATLSEDGTNIRFGLKGSSKFDMNKFNSTLLDPNSPSLVQLNGDMKDVTNNMIGGGEGKQSVIEKVFENKKIKPNEKGKITFEEGNNVLSDIANYPQEAILNNQQYSSSIYPQALSQTLGVYSSIKDLDDVELDPMQLKIKTLWKDNPYGMTDPINDYNKNGTSIIGNYTGAQVSYDRANSPEVIWDREITQAALNNSYAQEHAYPMIDVKISQQGLKSTFEKTVDPETGEVTRTLIDQELPSDNLTEEMTEFNTDEKLNIIN